MHSKRHITGISTSRERILQLSNMDYPATYRYHIGDGCQQNVYRRARYLQGQLHTTYGASRKTGIPLSYKRDVHEL